MNFKMKDSVTIKRWYPPKAVIVPPVVRPGSTQRTVLRHDENGQYFVDEFTERSLCSTKENRRNMTWIACPILEFNVALNCCHHYCSAPCGKHLETLQAKGWYRNGEQPPYADRMKKRSWNTLADENE